MNFKDKNTYGIMERFKKFRKYSTGVLSRSKLKEDRTNCKIIPEITERLRKLGRYSLRILNRSKVKETADFNFVTDFKEEKCSIIWRIENVHRCTLKYGEFLESPAFSTRFCSEAKWTLRIYPRGREIENLKRKKSCPKHERDEGCKTVGLFINRVSETPVASSYRCRLSYKRDLLNSTPKEMCSYYFPDIEMDSTNSSEYGTDNLLCTESLKYPQTLLIRCEFYVTNAYNKGAPGTYMPGLSKSCSLYQDLKQMYETGKFSDITLQVRDVQFCAHKAVLASRSEVFDAMFRHHMKETQTNIVHIQDIEPAIMSNTLQYIYTGNIDDFNIVKAIALYPVSEKYLLEELKNWCIDVMVANLTVENVCQIAVLVDLYPDPKLKKATFGMFRNYTSDIFKRKEWQDLVQDSDHHALVSSILEAVSEDFITNCH